MNTYKIGNKSTCIIRSIAPCTIGDDTLAYKNQPYTIIKEVDAEITFKSINKDSTSVGNSLNYQRDFVDTITLSNVLLTNKILNLIGSKNEEKLCNTFENCISDDDKKIYLSNCPAQEIYQVFIYNTDSSLEAAYGSLEINDGIEVNNANESYLICYSYEGDYSINLEKQDNIYVTLDLQLTGNIDDESSTMWIHLEKCSLTTGKRFLLKGNSNTTDLTFKVINSNDNYITFK